MKISIIGAGNVGSLSAMRISQDNLGEVVLIDIVKGLAKAKSLDLEDARANLKNNYHIQGSDDISLIKDSDIIVITAGLTRKPGMTREELLSKNSAILKEISQNIKKLAPKAVLIVVTNPLDLMTYFVLKATGFSVQSVIGMGISLDASRFANLISQELKVPVTDIEAWVIGSHGEGMLPLTEFTMVKKSKLNELLDEKSITSLLNRTVARGQEIITLLGSGSAYFAPSAAVAEIVKAIVKDENKALGVCAYLNGEYGIKDVCLGVPCRVGKQGVKEIIEFALNAEEKKILQKSAETVRALAKQLNL